MWAFCSGVIPFIKGAGCSTCAAAAAAIEAEATFTTADKMPNMLNVINALTPAVINAMGIKCADLGGWADMPVCTDTSACTATSCAGTDVMSHADSAKCSALDAYDATKICAGFLSPEMLHNSF